MGGWGGWVVLVLLLLELELKLLLMLVLLVLLKEAIPGPCPYQELYY